MNSSTLFSSLIVALFLGVFQIQAGADDKKMRVHALSEWKFGRTLFGEKVRPEELQGRVVVLAYWGAKCSACREGLADLAALDGQYREEGLRVIGAESYRSGRREIAAVVDAQKVAFSIIDGVKGPISLMGLPQVVVFGADGALLFSGHPKEKKFQKVVQRAMAQVNDGPETVLGGEVPLNGESEGFRTWRNHEGKLLVAAFKKIQGEKVMFILKDGSEVFYEIEKLSKEDQEWLRDKSARSSIN